MRPDLPRAGLPRPGLPRRRALPLLTAGLLLVTACTSGPPRSAAQGPRREVGPHPGSAVFSELSVAQGINALPRPADLFLPASGTRLTMQAAQHDFGLPGGRLTTVWGYAAPGQTPGYLGPTLRVTGNTPTRIVFRNALPAQLPFPLDRTRQPGPPMVDPLGHAVPHLHGGHTDAGSDGLPDQSFPSGTERTFTYRNDQRGATLWYHDHAMGA